MGDLGLGIVIGVAAIVVSVVLFGLIFAGIAWISRFIGDFDE